MTAPDEQLWFDSMGAQFTFEPLPAYRSWLSGRSQWAELIESRHTPAQWTVIADAIRAADARTHDSDGEPIVRGGEAWCQLALKTLDTPAAAAAEQAAPPSDRCWHDGDLIRAWLNAPNAYSNPDGVATVADTVDLPTWGAASLNTEFRGAHDVIEAAQDAGVFGVHGFRIHLHRLVDDLGYDIGHLMVAQPGFGPGLAAAPTADFMPARVSALDGACVVLHRAASIVDETLDRRDIALRATPVPAAVVPQARPFPPPTAGCPPAAPTTAAAPADPPSPARAGRRHL